MLSGVFPLASYLTHVGSVYLLFCHFSLVVFNILCLSLIVSLITMCLGVFLLCLPGTLCFLELVDYFFSHVRKVFSYYLFKYFFSGRFSLLILESL